MSGVAVITELLATNPALKAAIVANALPKEPISDPEANVMAGTIPLNWALPAIGIKQISEVERLTLNMGEPAKLVTERVQATVQARSYQAQKQLLELARLACRNQRGTINGVAVDSILPDTVGPDDDDVETGIFTQTRDFIVKWYRMT